MTVIPKRNLPPGAEPWGRSVDARVQAIEQASARQRQDNDNTLTGLNSSLVRLSEQVGEIRTITETLVEQQATLQAQQATLTAQQAQLTQTVAELQTVVNGMIWPRRNGGEFVFSSISPTLTSKGTISFATPEGYSRALVFGVSTFAVSNNSGTSDFVYGGVRIQGIPNNESLGQGQAGGGWETLTATATRLITDLSVGQIISVEPVVRTQSQTWTSNGMRVNSDVQVLFLR